jgi:VIT1/CCC1 family predicted Fe2+/Mn2+ transporter
LFATGAIFPVVPFFVFSGSMAVIGSVVLSGFALAAVGAGTSIFTGRGLLFSAWRQLMIGYAAALVTFGIGRLAGVVIG